MDRMAVCYFCGTVVDSPDPTPLLPASLRGGDGPTIDLCGDCREKYGAVREAIGDAVGAADEPADDAAGPDVSAPGSGAGSGDVTIGDQESGADASGTVASEGTGSEPNGDDDAFADVSVSKADFRRVMRLLENRDLPVERSEIEAVASNAYDIPGSTCTAILDAAAERGHVVVEDGRIVEAE